MTGPTHDWSTSVDLEHLGDVRARAAELAPTGVLHLVLEVLAYAAEEAEARGSGRATVVLHDDGSVTVADDGRGTEVRVVDGRAVRKPVMSTRDLRFYDADDAPLLPDGHPRRGISVVSTLSDRLVHTNRRTEGAWRQPYEHGVPADDLRPIPSPGPTSTTETTGTTGTTGTTVIFHPGPDVAPRDMPAGPALDVLTHWPVLVVDVRDQRVSPARA